MNSANVSEITGELFAMSRSALDASNGACGPFVTFDSVLETLPLVRLDRIGAFWERDKGQPDDDLLADRVQDLIAGLYAARKPWAFILRGTTDGIECGFGAATPGIVDSIGSSFPGSQVSIGWRPLRDGWKPASANTLCVTGIPTRKTDHLERLCRGLSGKDWLYMVYAHPQTPADVRAQGIRTELRLSEIKQTYLYRDAVPNAPAERLAKMLEAQTKRFQLARSLGMWDAYAALSFKGDADVGDIAAGLLSSAYAGKKSLPEPLRVRLLTPSEPEEPNTWSVLTTAECATLATPPREDRPGYEVIPDIRFGVQPSPIRTGGMGIVIGEIVDRVQPTGNIFAISERDLTKHGLIVGVTGAGKTNTCFELLAQIWREGQGVPFMVLESAKSEYRDLLNDPRFAGIRVYTVGNENISPIRINPFAVADGVLVQSHIDFLKALFSAAFVLYPPMPYVLDQALHEVYQDFGWDLVTNTNVRGSNSDLLFPTLDDLIEKTREVVNGLGYDKRLEMDIQAGLVARLDGLRRGGGKGPMLNTRASTSDEDLFERPCVIELKALVTDEEKAFLIGLMLIRLHEYYESRPHRHDGGLRHVTLIEEAHRLLRNVSTEQGSEVSSNPKGQAVEVFGNMLAEIRAFGEGVLIAEQVPSKLLPDAIKNTNLKIVHRMVAADDRKLIGDTMNLDEEQNAFVSTLGTGEAVVYAEGIRKSVLVRVRLADVKRTGGRVADSDVAKIVLKGQHCFTNFPLLGCTGCPESGKRKSCNKGHASKRLIGAARAVIQDLRFGTYTRQRFEDLLSLCKVESTAATCVINEVAESLVQRLGRLNRWSAGDTTNLLDDVLAVTQKLPVVPETVISVLAEKFKLIETRIGPFEGCQACETPCRFRFDVADAEKTEFSKAYMQTFAPSESAFKDRWKSEVVLPVVRLMFETIPTNNQRVANGAAYCFAVQNIASVSKDQREIRNALLLFKDTLA